MGNQQTLLTIMGFHPSVKWKHVLGHALTSAQNKLTMSRTSLMLILLMLVTLSVQGSISTVKPTVPVMDSDPTITIEQEKLERLFDQLEIKEDTVAHQQESLDRLNTALDKSIEELRILSDANAKILKENNLLMAKVQALERHQEKLEAQSQELNQIVNSVF